MMIGQILGFGLGILASYLVWHITFRVITPKLKFSNKISKMISDDESHYVYRVKYSNTGNRNIIDADFYIEMKIRGIYKSRPRNWKIIDIKTNRSKTFLIKPMKQGGNIIHIKINETEFFGSKYMPNEIQKKYEDKTLELEDLFGLPNEVTLEIIMLGYDEYSGSRKLFRSKPYLVEDIFDGLFERATLNPSSDLIKEELVQS